MDVVADVSRPAIRYHGAKFRLASWILQFFPEHECYVEPYGGAAGVLLQKPRSYAEVYNDIDGEITNFFSVVRDPASRERLIEALLLTPYARVEFDLAYEPTDDPVEMARRTAIKAQMGFGSAGATKGKTGFRVDSAREYGTAWSLWSRYPESLSAVGNRFTNVLIENLDALDVMTMHDAPTTLHYVDPPYLLSTRQMHGLSRYYRYEMTDTEHVRLLDCLKALQGMVVLSGYDSPVYREMLSAWPAYSTQSVIAAGRGSGKRTEMVWMNQACHDALYGDAGPLFRAL
ncbi:DNA methyltransferase (plasmid) [Bordetella flabilis]|uniref:DNA methyltransferase n=2 Tax=Bordetella flabilis TaxID=463014 RepID=A0A193GM01_9BORD|nr:DNA methyltransferase [Bordetella flabilis]